MLGNVSLLSLLALLDEAGGHVDAGPVTSGIDQLSKTSLVLNKTGNETLIENRMC